MEGAKGCKKKARCKMEHELSLRWLTSFRRLHSSVCVCDTRTHQLQEAPFECLPN
jgi:hypothetical protein